MGFKKFIPALIAVTAIVLICIYSLFNSGYKLILKNDGISFGMPKAEEDYVAESLANHSIQIKEDGKTSSISYKDAGVTVIINGVKNTKFIQDLRGLTVDRYLPNNSKVMENIRNTRTEFSSGHLEIDDEYNLIAVGSTQSTQVDEESLFNYINDQVKSGFDIYVNLEDYYINQNDTVELQNMKDSIKKYNEFSITYTNGFVLDSKVLAKRKLISINDDGTFSVDVSVKTCKDIAGKNLTGYNTIGETRDFTTHDGRAIKIKSQTFGTYIDYEAEGAYLKEAITNMKSEKDRDPIFKQSEEVPFDKTYIELDKQNQHIYYYVDNELVLDTDVVTGLPTQKRDTPAGIWFIINKARDTRLKGESWDVEVDYWMGVTYSGVGFHDAQWRNKFGGNIWKNNGSHGCINTPLDKMKELYEKVEVGTAVIIY